MKKTLFTFCIACIIFFMAAKPPLSLKPQNRVRRVVIDAGHGGKDPGCLGKSCKEKDVALAIAKSTKNLIEKHYKDVFVILTRGKDEFVELRERARRANKEAGDMFISVHCNAAPTPAMVGAEVYVMGLELSEENLAVAQRENSTIIHELDYQKHYEGYAPNSPLNYILFTNTQKAYHENSVKMAKYIETLFRNDLKRDFRGVKQANFLVLWKTAMPSVLVEVGFLTNETEESFLSQGAGQSHVANTLYRAFRDYKEAVEAR